MTYQVAVALKSGDGASDTITWLAAFFAPVMFRQAIGAIRPRLKDWADLFSFSFAAAAGLCGAYLCKSWFLAVIGTAALLCAIYQWRWAIGAWYRRRKAAE